MLLNLWDNNELTQSFMELYGITGVQMCNIIKCIHLNTNLDYINVFCEETGIKLDDVNIAYNIDFLGKIVSTTTDNFEYLHEVGLVSLDFLLEHDSPISCHLKKYDIEINPRRHELIYNGNKFHIPSYNQDCKWCSLRNKQCTFIDKKNKDMYCSYRKAINPLAIKLYSDDCEIEMFLSASKNDMIKYSTVNRYPEIFSTVDSLVEKLFKKHLNIGNEWCKAKQSSYVITAPVKYNDFSYKNNYINANNGIEALAYFQRYKMFCSKDYYHVEDVPICFWDNIWIINTCLNLIVSCGESNGYICAGIKHDIQIPYNKLKIEII